MTATQKQCLLAYFGFIKPKEIDGIWGPKSAEATKKLQAQLGLEDDGVWGNATDRAAKEALTNGFVPVIDDFIEIENTQYRIKILFLLLMLIVMSMERGLML